MLAHERKMLARILKMVALHHGISERQALHRSTVEARRQIYYLARSLTDLSSTVIGKYYGVHHTTVLAGTRVIGTRVGLKAMYRAEIEALVAVIETVVLEQTPKLRRIDVVDLTPFGARPETLESRRLVDTNK